MSSQDNTYNASLKQSTESPNEATISQKSLSRASVYASLKSLDVSDDFHLPPSNARIPKNLQDESLISFYATLSKEYHHNVPRLDGKNTSGRSLSAADVSGRIRQRALTLVGGGYNANPVSTSSMIAAKKKLQTKNFLSRGHRASSNISGRHGKRKRSNLWHRVNHATSCGVHCAKDQIFNHDMQFLMRLNHEWIVYIKSVLDLDSSIDGSMLDDALLQKQIATLTEEDIVEWVGSFVRIKKCEKISKFKGSLEGMKGILISHSAFSWEIAPIRRKKKRPKPKMDPTTVNSYTFSRSAEGCFLDNQAWNLDAAISIPKRGSIVAVQIPLMSNSSFSSESMEETQFISVILQGT
jgi:hypothetical protein